jgi:putative ABC transport system substrate-binding protein
VTRAQQGERRRIGVFIGYAESDPEAQSFLKIFVQELQGLGWTDGGNLRIDVRWSGADASQIPPLARELVDLKPDVIFCNSTPVTDALVRTAKTIPIVFTIVSDPVGAGFVASLARPGGGETSRGSSTSSPQWRASGLSC